MILDTVAVVLAWHLVLRCVVVPPGHLVETGNRYYQEGLYPQAERCYRKVFGDRRLGYLAHYNAGNAAYQQGKYALAVSLYETALDLQPADEDVWHNLELARRHMKPGVADSGRARPPTQASDQLLSLAKEQEKRLRLMRRPEHAAGKRIPRDFFSLPPEELLKQMRAQMENSYSFRPQAPTDRETEPIPDDVDW